MERWVRRHILPFATISSSKHLDFALTAQFFVCHIQIIRPPVYFRLPSPNYEKEFGCRKQLMDEKYTTKHPVRKDSDTWKLLLEQNRFDVHLYDFAKELFSQQSYIFGL
jgi:hypothetical protein